MTPATQIKVLVLTRSGELSGDERTAFEATHNALLEQGYVEAGIQSTLYAQTARHYTLFLGETEVMTGEHQDD